MPSPKSPFVKKSIVCPVCQKETPQRFFRQRMFMPDKRESDQHVTRYKWQNENVHKVHPGYYALYFCPECRFTDTTGEFANPQKDGSAFFVRRAFKRETGSSVLVQLLGQHLDYGDIDFASALDLHFLAITIHSRVDEDHLDTYKLGRLYLRTAWLYREQNGAFPEGVEPDGKPDAAALPEEEPTSMDVAKALLQAVEGMETSLDQLSTEWGEVQGLLRERIREIAKSALPGGENPYPGCFTALNGLDAKYLSATTSLKDVCLRDVAGVLLGEAPSTEDTEQSKPGGLRNMFPTHEAYLSHIRTLWPEVPLTEKEALDKAATYFNQTISSDSRFHSLDSHLKLSMLVANLMLRQDDLNGAFEVARGLYRAAIDDRQKAQKLLRDPEISDTKRRGLENLARQAGTAIEQVSDFRYELLDMMIDRDRDKIKEIIQASSTNGGKVEEALAAEGIVPEVLTRLRKRGR